MGDTFLSSVDLPSEEAIREGVATGSIKLSGGPRKRRARAYTFTGRDNKDGKDTKGNGEVRKGFRTIMKMLSKAHIKGEGVDAGVSVGGGDPGLALSRQKTRG